MSDDAREPVRVAYAMNQSEAELIQGLLHNEGIPSFARRASGFDVPDMLAAGPREILVAADREAEARDLLDAPITESEEPEPESPTR
jgi:hypothetical protein